MSINLFKLELIVPDAETAESFMPAVDPFCFAASAYEVDGGGEWRLEAYCDGMPDHDAVVGALALTAAATGLDEPYFSCVPVPDIDWVTENQKSFVPLRAGRFFVYPSIYEGVLPGGAWPICIDAGMAFGTGEHATTHGCLALLDGLAKQGRISGPVLDLGCGSGILAIGMARAWPGLIIDASDIDPVSTRIARENAVLNRVGPAIRPVTAIGFGHRDLNKTYTLIMANILANPLCDLAPDMRRHTADGSLLILSGLLVEQEKQILSAYRHQGFFLQKRHVRNGWLSLLLYR